jgi:hypothetical protein
MGGRGFRSNHEDETDSDNVGSDDSVPPSLRGKYFGLNDLFLGISAVSMPVVGGLVIASLGFSYLGLLGLAVTVGTAPLAHRRLGLMRQCEPKIYLA